MTCMANAFILCDLLWKVQKNHAANKEGNFKSYNKLVFNEDEY